MEFPRALFPGFYNEGPSIQKSSCAVSSLGWGGYGRVHEEVREPGQGRFIPLYSRTAERWEPTEPTPAPLLPPNADCGIPPVTEADLVYKKVKKAENTSSTYAGTYLHFSKQVSRFCWDQSGVAFQSMGPLLEPHFYLGERRLKEKNKVDRTTANKLSKILQNAPHHDCPFPYSGFRVRSLSFLCCDWLPDTPPALLGQLVNEGMEDEWKQLQFQDSITGGALSWAPYPGGSGGCLIYPGGAAMNRLHFQQMRVKRSRVKLDGDPGVFHLQHRVLQVSTGEVGDVYVGVRSAYNVAAWSFSADDPPRPLGVVRTRTPSTCVNVSPHLPGELCVCTESGTLYLWNLERGLQSICTETETLFFRDDPLWRWSDFTSHPRVLLYADRTGVQAADMRVGGARGLDLFRIGQDSSSEKGERVIMSRCLRETNPAQFLVTTQFSVYMMDDRFPLVPLVKWSHMLERPPSLVTVLPGGGAERTNKILLGTQHSQETLLLQYSGGDLDPCRLHLPALRLPRNMESLRYLDPLLPHHRDIVAQRLDSPMAGLAASYASPKVLVVFQLTDAGDVFTQKLKYRKSPKSGHVSRRNPSCTPDGSAQTEDGAAADPTTQEAASERGAAAASDETSSTTQTFSTSSAHEEAALLETAHLETAHETSSVISLSARSECSFQKWTRDLVKLCKHNAERIKRPGFSIKRLFRPSELSKTPPSVDGLRDRLRQGMRSGGLVKLDSPASPEEVQLVYAENWKDPLSERLTAAWEGQLGQWWDDYLGLNKLSKVQALREKRRRQKLQRSRSHTSLASLSFGSDFCDTEVSSQWSFRSAPSSPGDGLTPGPEEVHETRPPAFTERSPQNVTEPPELCAPISSQSLRLKGIPRERRRVLQDFLTIFGASSDLLTSAPPPPQDPPPQNVQPQSPSGPSTVTEPPSFSRLTRGAPTFPSSQSLSQSAQRQTHAQHSSMETLSLSQSAQRETRSRMSLRSGTQSHLQSLSQSAQRETHPQHSQISQGQTCSQMETMSLAQSAQKETHTQHSQSSQSLSQSLQTRAPMETMSLRSAKQSHLQSLSQSAQRQTHAQHSQMETMSLAQSAQRETHAQHSQVETMSLAQSAQRETHAQHSQVGTMSQRSGTQSRVQRPPAKRFRMGF